MTRAIQYNAFEQISEDRFQPLEKWGCPTGDEIKSALRHAGLSAESFSKIIGVEGRTVRRWTNDEVLIPYASWCLLCLEAGYHKFWGKPNYNLK